MKFAAIIPQFAAKLKRNGGKSRSYTHDLESFHPIQTVLTPMAAPIFTHDQRLTPSIAEPIPQYSKTHPTASAFASDTFPSLSQGAEKINGIIAQIIGEG